MLRIPTTADRPGVISLWADVAARGAADLPESDEDVARSFIQSLFQQSRVVVRDGGLTGFARCRRQYTEQGEVVIRLDPLLASDESAERELYEWASTSPEVTQDVSGIDSWVVSSSPGLVAEYRFEPIRTFVRLDRETLDDVTSTPLPGDLYFAEPGDPRVDMDAWARLYNDAFAGEFRQVRTAAGPLWVHLIEPGRLGIAALDGSGAPVGLVIGGIENRPACPLEQPIANIYIVCTAAHRRKEGIAEAALREALIRLRNAGARSATIRSDEDSQYRSYRLYQRVGFRQVQPFRVWNRSLP